MIFFFFLADWENNFITRKTYHIIITAEKYWETGLTDSILTEDMALAGHLLYGRIHINGFGHLLAINGVEEGLDYLPRDKIMAVWESFLDYVQPR